jgi:restriction system protein
MIQYNISDNDFKELLNDISKIEYSLPKGMEKFHLESLLEDFLVATWDNIEEFKNLQIYKSDKGRIGKQYPTKTGLIDILCIDKKNNDFVVFELKKDKPTDGVIGQIKRYMGWVKEELAKDGQNVRGIIIAAVNDDKLKYALKTITDVKLMTYSINFQLKQH